MSEFYSQHGEDKWLLENWVFRQSATFIEVGAYDGVLSSNTLCFEKLGWNGFLVEADCTTAQGCRINRKAPTFVCAVGSVPGFSVFRVNPSDHGLSGFGRDGDPVIVEVRRLDELVQASGLGDIDILSIDTEGSELDVWTSLGTRRLVNPPAVVIMEHYTLGLPPNDLEVGFHMSGFGYKLIHKTACNMIFAFEGKQ